MNDGNKRKSDTDSAFEAFRNTLNELTRKDLVDLAEKRRADRVRREKNPFRK